MKKSIIIQRISDLHARFQTLSPKQKNMFRASIEDLIVRCHNDADLCDFCQRALGLFEL